LKRRRGLVARRAMRTKCGHGPREFPVIRVQRQATLGKVGCGCVDGCVIQQAGEVVDNGRTGRQWLVTLRVECVGNRRAGIDGAAGGRAGGRPHRDRPGACRGAAWVAKRDTGRCRGDHRQTDDGTRYASAYDYHSAHPPLPAALHWTAPNSPLNAIPLCDRNGRSAASPVPLSRNSIGSARAAADHIAP